MKQTMIIIRKYIYNVMKLLRKLNQPVFYIVINVLLRFEGVVHVFQQEFS
jgi:hypothetical protein